MHIESQKAQAAQGKLSILHHDSSEVTEQEVQRDSEISVLAIFNIQMDAHSSHLF